MSEDTLADFEEKLNLAINSIEEKCNLEIQVKNAENILTEKFQQIISKLTTLNNLGKSASNIKNREINLFAEDNDVVDQQLCSMTSQLDKMRNHFYHQYKPIIRDIEEVHMIGDKVLVSQLDHKVATENVTQVQQDVKVVENYNKLQRDNQPEILKEVDRDNLLSSKNLPLNTVFVKPVPTRGDLVYVMNKIKNPWIKAKVRLQHNTSHRLVINLHIDIFR